MDVNFKAKANSRQEALNSIKNQITGYLRRKGMSNRYAEIQSTEWKVTELFGGGEMTAHVYIKDAKMSYRNFIDSVVGNIARKIEDEFNESDHPRDKDGKFASDSTKEEDVIPETEVEKYAKEEISETEIREDRAEYKQVAAKAADEVAAEIDEAPAEKQISLWKASLKYLGISDEELEAIETDDKEVYYEKFYELAQLNPEKAYEAMRDGDYKSQVKEELENLK